MGKGLQYKEDGELDRGYRVYTIRDLVSLRVL